MVRKVLTIALFWLFTPAAFVFPTLAEASSCVINQVREKFMGREFVINQVSGAHIRKSETDIRKILGDKNHLVVGVTGDHVYLYANGTRHHGKMSLKMEGFRKIIPDTHLAQDGLLMVFEDIPQSDLDALQSRLLSRIGKRDITLSCITSACGEIRTATGIRVRDGNSPIPTVLLKRMLKSGFVDKNGNPVPVQIYRTNEIGFQDVVNNFQRLQTSGTLMVSLAAGALALLVVPTVDLVKMIRDKNRPRTLPSPSIGLRSDEALRQEREHRLILDLLKMRPIEPLRP